MPGGCYRRRVGLVDIRVAPGGAAREAISSARCGSRPRQGGRNVYPLRRATPVGTAVPRHCRRALSTAWRDICANRVLPYLRYFNTY
jgi:hypothetical protein